jgi:capsule polysaccharide export protein KpsE/RkpR
MKTGIITIAVENRNPRKASAMAQEMVDALNELLAQVNTSAAHRERVFIEERLQAVKQELDSATKEFSVFASQNTAINIPDQAKAMVAAAADLQGQLIAAESQLKSMQQIYTDNNVNVRQMKALVAELQSQLNKFGGKDVTPANGSKLSSDELYPSIRQLPLLGVRYLDLFRRSKINEAAFAMLSKEYEIAKVEEAREVPSVAVLDAPTIPQKKSSPHRLVIMLLGTAFSFCLAMGIVLGRNGWEEIETDDPRKILAVEIFSTVRGRLRWNSRNGHSALAHSSGLDGEPDMPSDCIGKERG